MALGKRRRRQPKQTSMWVATQDLPRNAAHPFYTRLNQILDENDFDGYVEGLCERFMPRTAGQGCRPGARIVKKNGVIVGPWSVSSERLRHSLRFP